MTWKKRKKERKTKKKKKVGGGRWGGEVGRKEEEKEEVASTVGAISVCRCCVIEKIVSFALQIYLGLGLALPKYEPWRSLKSVL